MFVLPGSDVVLDLGEDRVSIDAFEYLDVALVDRLGQLGVINELDLLSINRSKYIFAAKARHRLCSFRFRLVVCMVLALCCQPAELLR